ncbi:hypothetical protein HG535_0A00550 [Zygotorulaspora mrakii]|uniref:Uncharacterized protein n=1 Tax=Zygotorulaspora mrakii TaxID=42260 RepID=A0A7H9AV42_ZYGMR|nr:uncharacterized protein HG535_0A00550 [Zygotorulaspora mrakii]QLG70116.1 hypothetical protein HG535_0A00550 [Zygotorulaspora mrakii]
MNIQRCKLRSLFFFFSPAGQRSKRKTNSSISYDCLALFSLSFFVFTRRGLLFKNGRHHSIMHACSYRFRTVGTHGSGAEPHVSGFARSVAMQGQMGRNLKTCPCVHEALIYHVSCFRHHCLSNLPLGTASPKGNVMYFLSIGCWFLCFLC